MRENPSALSNNLVLGLVERLPEPGAVWPAESRLRWHETAASIFALLYRGEDEVQAVPSSVPMKTQAVPVPVPRAIPAPSSPITPAKKSRGLSAAKALKDAPKGPGRPAGELEASVLAALDAGGALSVREVMAWLEKHRRELALSKSNLYSCVWAVLQRLERSGVVEDGDRDGVRVFSKKKN